MGARAMSSLLPGEDLSAALGMSLDQIKAVQAGPLRRAHEDDGLGRGKPYARPAGQDELLAENARLRAELGQEELLAENARLRAELAALKGKKGRGGSKSGGGGARRG